MMIFIVVIFFIAAVITPPDIISQIMVAIPIVALYELSIALSQFVYKLRHKDDDPAEDEEKKKSTGLY